MFVKSYFHYASPTFQKWIKIIITFFGAKHSQTLRFIIVGEGLSSQFDNHPFPKGWTGEDLVHNWEWLNAIPISHELMSYDENAAEYQ